MHITSVAVLAVPVTCLAEAPKERRRVALLSRVADAVAADADLKKTRFAATVGGSAIRVIAFFGSFEDAVSADTRCSHQGFIVRNGNDARVFRAIG